MGFPWKLPPARRDREPAPLEPDFLQPADAVRQLGDGVLSDALEAFEAIARRLMHDHKEINPNEPGLRDVNRRERQRVHARIDGYLDAVNTIRRTRTD